MTLLCDVANGARRFVDNGFGVILGISTRGLKLQN